jgi:ubiquinone/menaquinone biosynthesis C-methylase UbiE
MTPTDERPAGNPPIDFLSTRDGYDRWASIYDGEDNPLVALEQPRVAQLLGDVTGLAVADIGCGTGRHALRLAAAGARVTAIDFSKEMLDKARGKPGAAGVHFVRHDLVEPLPFDASWFDRVVCGLVLEHIADPGFLLAEMKRICRPAGFLVVSAMHPAMMLRGITARFTDPQSGRETRPQSYPHQVSDYVMAAVRAGLTLDHLSEHAVDLALAERSPRARKYLGWPMLLVMRLKASRAYPSGDQSHPLSPGATATSLSTRSGCASVKSIAI